MSLITIIRVPPRVEVVQWGGRDHSSYHNCDIIYSIFLFYVQMKHQINRQKLIKELKQKKEDEEKQKMRSNESGDQPDESGNQSTPEMTGNDQEKN